MNTQSIEPSWLDPQHVKRRLVHAGLFLLSYELLKSSIVDGVRDFYLTGFKDDEYTYSPQYNSRVLAKAKHVFEASLLWLREADVLSDQEVKQIQKLRDDRNKVAHEIPKFIFESSISLVSLINATRDFIRKVDRFWGQVEADRDPDLQECEIDYEGIVSLRSLALDYIAVAVNQDASESADGRSMEAY